MSFLHRLFPTEAYWRLDSVRSRHVGGVRTPKLRVEFLEGRICLSPIAHYQYVVLSSYGNNSIVRYNEITGQPAPAEGQPGATLVPSRGCGLASPLEVLFAPNGDLLVSGGENNDILRINRTTGTCLGDFVDQGSGGLTVPTGMVFSPDHTAFYVASNFNNRILRYSYNGTTGTNPTVLVSDPSLAGPVGMLFGPDGYLYVSTLNSSSVLRFDAQTGAAVPAPGQSGADFVPSGSGGLNRAGGIAFGPDGNLYVASQNTNTVMRYDGTTGDPLPADGQDGATFVPAGSGGLSRPVGLLFGPSSDRHFPYTLYVISLNTDNVLAYHSATGDFLCEFIGAGSGGLSAPRSLAFGNTDPSTLDYVYDNRGLQLGGPDEAIPLDNFVLTEVPEVRPGRHAPDSPLGSAGEAATTGNLAETSASLPPLPNPAGSSLAIVTARSTGLVFRAARGSTIEPAEPAGPLNAAVLDVLALNLLDRL
jgi:DNA-binding beta-propeller fold protein YncE